MENEKMTATHIDEVRSWTVVNRRGRPVLLPTKWQPGYTPAHKATEKEALLYAVIKLQDQITSIQLELSMIALLADELDDDAPATARVDRDREERSQGEDDDLLPLGFGIPDIQEETDEEFRVRQEARDRAALNND